MKRNFTILFFPLVHSWYKLYNMAIIEMKNEIAVFCSIFKKGEMNHGKGINYRR